MQPTAIAQRFPSRHNREILELCRSDALGGTMRFDGGTDVVFDEADNRGFRGRGGLVFHLAGVPSLAFLLVG